MTNIIDYIRRPAVFEPEIVSAMGNAYERALASFDELPSKAVREVVAGRIISLAQKGERDPRVLCEKALAAIGVLNKCEQAEKPSSQSSQ